MPSFELPKTTETLGWGQDLVEHRLVAGARIDRAKVVDAAVDVPGLDAAALGEALTAPVATRVATLTQALDGALTALAARGPLVVACEDLQWADTASLESIVRLTGLIAIGLNLPYVLAVRTGYALLAQAYLRSLVDVALITAVLYAAGVLGAAPSLGFYALGPASSGRVLSSPARTV